MYNGIGLATPRGSGTNGHVQRNWASIKPKIKEVSYKSDHDLAVLDIVLSRQPNQEILDHERKRKIELKCTELADILEEQGFSEQVICKKVNNYRSMLMGQEKIEKPVSERSRSCVTGTHRLAEAQQVKNARLREAFGISEYFVDGSSFDSNRQAKEQLGKNISLYEKEKELIECGKKRYQGIGYELVHTPSPEPSQSVTDGYITKNKKRKQRYSSAAEEPKNKRKKKYRKKSRHSKLKEKKKKKRKAKLSEKSSSSESSGDEEKMKKRKKESSKKKKYTSEKSRESSPSQNNNVVLDDYPFKHEKRNKLMKDISCNRDKSIKDLPKSKLSKDEKYLNYEKSFFFEKGSFQKNRSKKFLQDNRNKDFFGKRDSSYNQILQSREKTKRSESRGIGGNISNSMLIANKMPQEKSTSFYKNQSKDNLNNSNSDIDNSEYKFLSECKNSKHDKFKYIGRSTPQSRNDKLIDTYWDKKYRLPDHDNKKLNLSTSPISENRAYKDNKHSDFENRLSKNTKYTYDKNSSASRHNSVKFSHKSYHDIETTKNASKDVITVFQTSNVKVTHCSRKNNYEKEIKSKNKEQNYNDEQSKKRNEKKSPNSIKDKTSKKSLTPDFKSGLTSSYIHKSKSPVEKKLKKRDIDKQVKYNKPLPVVRLRASSSETGISDSEFDKEKEDDGDDKMLKLLKTDLAAKAKESLERKKEKPNPQYPMKEIIQPDIFDIKISPMKTGKDNLQGDFKNGFDIKSNRDIYKVQANLKIRSKSQSKSSCQSSTSSNGSCRSKSLSYSSHSLSRSRTVSRSNTRSSSTSSSTQSSSTAHSRSPSIPRRHGSPSFLDRRRITR